MGTSVAPARFMFKSSCRAAIAFSVLLLVITVTPSEAATYDVGPSRQYTAIGMVPWESLQPGDVVLIHWRPEPYREKWVICRRGTQSQPIVVRGVPGPNGERPVIDGRDATTRSQLNFWAGPRGVIVIGGARVPADTTPAWIVVENLDVANAHPDYQFTDYDGSRKAFTSSASAIYVEKGENITVRNCWIRGSANGLFVASTDSLPSSDILIENNYIYDNGIIGSVFQHNSYTAARNITFQGNRYGPMRSGASGNALKDRSSGVVVRYNWIEGGSRQLDLVDAEDSSLIRNDPAYRRTFVYGNVLIEPAGAANRQIVHYGGDHEGMEAQFRKGTLYFYNNTLISKRTDRTTLLRLSTNDESADVRNNILYTVAAGDTLSLLDESGRLTFSRNWVKPGYVQTFGTLSGSITDDNTSVTGSSPGFVDEAGGDYSLASGSQARNAAGALNSNVLPTYDVFEQYVRHQLRAARPRDAAMDIGAYEGSGSASATPPDPPTNLRIIR